MDSKSVFREIEPFISERVDIVIPSRLDLIDPVVSYLADHLVQFGYMDSNSNTALALHEALTNAIRHGNQLDTLKKVRIAVKINQSRASISITDEGPGFDPADVGDPTQEENLFREGGRGLLMIRHLMDEVRYNRRGNQITMIKKPLQARSS